jgi:hypothetical protein
VFGHEERDIIREDERLGVNARLLRMSDWRFFTRLDIRFQILIYADMYPHSRMIGKNLIEVKVS